MKNLVSLGMFLFFVLTLTSCASAKSATAIIKATKEGSLVSGKVEFREASDGLKVAAAVQNVAPGKHGFHVHEKGVCVDGGNAAGGHFNPDGVSHGLLTKDGFAHAHAGDMGNMEVAADGTGSLETVLPGLTLDQGKYGITGRAVILHEKEDDFGQPTGNAGGRIGCGEIVVNQ